MNIKDMTFDEVVTELLAIQARWDARVGGFSNFPEGDLGPKDEQFVLAFVTLVTPILTKNEWDFARGADD